MIKCKCGKYTDYGITCSSCSMSDEIDRKKKRRGKEKDEEDNEDLIEEIDFNRLPRLTANEDEDDF